MLKWILVVAVAAIVFASSAMGNVVSLTSVQDTSIYQELPANSNGSGTAMVAGKTGAANGFSLRRALLEFDIADNIPAGATITDATLQLTTTDTGGNTGTAFTFTLHRLTDSWGEAGSTASPSNVGIGNSAQTGDATWPDRFYSTTSPTTWTTNGGDFSATVSATKSVQGTGAFQWAGSGLVADVQAWLNNPGGDFGWILLGQETTNSSVRQFATRENATVASRPTLTIDFTIPEPASMALLGVGGMLLLRRRR